MNDTTDNGNNKSGGKTLSLKRTVESGRVRQSISHGRSKSVVVEKKRKRTISAPGSKSGEAAAEAGKPAKTVKAKKAPAAKTPAAETPAAEQVVERAEVQAPAGRKLTSSERDARERALVVAKEREREERARAAEEAKRREEEERRQRAEQEAAAAREAEEAKRRRDEEERRKKFEEPEEEDVEEAAPAAAVQAKGEGEEAAIPAGGKIKKARVAPPKPERSKGEPRRRSTKLTIQNALDDNQRERSLSALRRRREREKRAARQADAGQNKIAREVTIPETITIQELANRMAEKAVDIIRLMMKQGQMVKINDVIDADTAQLIAEELGHSVKRVAESDVEEGIEGEEDRPEDLKSRAPVVTVMGHVDHGKTSLLDALRSTDVVGGEAGGITQHIGAYQVTMPSGDKITFLDTPGHAAFTAMRARGAKATDIVILVVAADDGIMPQTVEAINHAKAAEVPIIVAINKIDKPEADPNRVRTELLQHELVTEEMGGDILAVEVSALKGTNLDKLEEAILLQAELLELKANPDREGSGIVVEAQLDKGRGPVATVLVQRGTLNVGDIFVAGAEWGRVRALITDHGGNTEHAGPSVPVEVLGLNGTPEAGDQFFVVDSEARAREITEYRQRKRLEKRHAGAARGSLEQMFSQLSTSEAKLVPVVVKADVQGSAEAIVQALDKLGTDEVKAQVIHSAVGGITESDISLAAASGAVVFGFNVRANAQAREAAKRDDIEVRYYSVIYDLVDDVKAAMEGLLSPTLRETFLGNAEILEVFNVSKVGRVAGCRVTEGVVRRGSKVRLIRDDVVIHEGTLATLRRFKDEVKEVNAGQECGMGFENYQDIKEGDVIECFDVEEIARKLEA